MMQFAHRVSGWFTRKPTHPLEGGYLSSEEFLRSIGLIVGLDQLLENFSAKLREILDASNLYVVLFEPITNRYVGRKAKGTHPEWLAEFNFSRSDNLIKWLNVNKCALDVVRETEVLNFLSVQEQELLRKTDTVLVIPFIVVNRLTGALFMGRKTNGAVYTSSEIGTLSMLTSQSALAMEHALIYQFQEDKLKKIFHADRLATVGELAAGAAHEIRNPLTSIRSTVQYLQKDLPEERKPLVDGIIEEVDRIDQIIKGLLSFSKSSELHMSVINIEEVLNQTLLLLESELRNHNIDVQKRFDLRNPQITGDASQLKQAFLNILLNSIQAMPEGGKIVIAMTDNLAQKHVAQKEGIVCVTIRDTGPGIPEKDLLKVFDPFYTTKGTGTGLGLSISYGIVSKHGGEIEIESNTEGPNRGTMVLVRLPR